MSKLAVNMTGLLTGLLLSVGAAHAGTAPPPPETISTFSVVAYDPSTGEVGVAVQSRFFAVGSVVPWCKAGVGAVATQAFGQTTYGARGLALLEQGYTPDEALQVLLLNDEQADQRQVGIVGARGKGFAATYTGSECLDWAGGRTGVALDGVVYSVQGNILTGEAVIDAMAGAFENPASLDRSALTTQQERAVLVPGLAGRLLAALLGGQHMGGDSRGMQSAALKVSQEGAGYGGYNDVKYDLRVDDAIDPFEELARLVNLAYPIALTNEAYRVLYTGDHAQATGLFQRLVAVEPENANHHYNLACALSLAGDAAAALAELRQALDLDLKMLSPAKEDQDLRAVREMPEAADLFGQSLPDS